MLRAALISSADPSSQRTGSVLVIAARVLARRQGGRLIPLRMWPIFALDTPAASAMFCCAEFIMIRYVPFKTIEGQAKNTNCILFIATDCS